MDDFFLQFLIQNEKFKDLPIQFQNSLLSQKAQLEKENLWDELHGDKRQRIIILSFHLFFFLSILSFSNKEIVFIGTKEMNEKKIRKKL